MPASHFQSSSPSDRFSTTYSTDFSPISTYNPQLNAGTAAGQELTRSLQSEREMLPVLYHHFYTTTTTPNGSAVGSQPPSGSFFPAFLPSFGCLTPSFSEELRDAGNGGEEVALQELGGGTLVSFDFKGKDPRQNICGQRAYPSKQHKDEPKWKTDVHYEEGVVRLSPYRGPIGYDEFLQLLLRETRPPPLLALPMASSPFIRQSHNTESKTRENRLSIQSPAVQNSPFLQRSSRQCSYCGWKSFSCCCGTQSVPRQICQSSFKPLAHGQRSSAWTEPSRKQPLTEYQASYSAQWAQPKIYQI
ncbi:hypothetical protein CHARACLAT_022937 [Characodon lateralis]|uniref:Uncharacterized protein n=1 Tax=Characodon lateralis TaxID=208331 RepID=A0ABU7F6B8_9TELE|nr:hypothetical protein [Characodon lateralis]